MVSTGFSKSLSQPVAGLTLLAMIAIALPSPTRAQLPPNRVAPAPATAPTAPPPTAPAPAAAPAAQQAIQVPIDYALGGGDRIRINVFEVPEYTGDYQIPPGGELYLPLIGGVTVLGLTQAEAAEVIAAKYSRFLKRP